MDQKIYLLKRKLEVQKDLAQEKAVQIVNFRNEIAHLVNVIADKGLKVVDVEQERELLKEMLKAERNKRVQQKSEEVAQKKWLEMECNRLKLQLKLLKV